MLCAGAPDTPEIARRDRGAVEAVRRERGNVIWIEEMLPKPEVIQILSHATVFVVPVDLRAAGHRQPRGDGLRGRRRRDRDRRHPRGRRGRRHRAARPLSSRGRDGTGDAGRPGRASPPRFAERVNALLADPARAEAMGRAGRARAVERFGWDVAAAETLALYERLLGR